MVVRCNYFSKQVDFYSATVGINKIGGRNKMDAGKVSKIVERLKELEGTGEILSDSSGDGRIYFFGEIGSLPNVEHRLPGFQPVIVFRGRNYKEISDVAERFELRL